MNTQPSQVSLKSPAHDSSAEPRHYYLAGDEDEEEEDDVDVYCDDDSGSRRFGDEIFSRKLLHGEDQLDGCSTLEIQTGEHAETVKKSNRWATIASVPPTTPTSIASSEDIHLPKMKNHERLGAVAIFHSFEDFKRSVQCFSTVPQTF